MHGADTNAHSQELVKRLEEAKEKGPAASAPAPMEMPAADTPDLKEESNGSTNDSPPQTSVVTDRSRRSKSRANRQSAENDVRMEDAPPRRSETYIPPPVIPPPRHAQPVVPSTPAAKAQNTLPLQGEPHDTFKLLLEVLEEILEAHGGYTQGLGEGKLHSELYMRCSIRQYNGAREITHFYAKSLLEELPQKWNSSPFWNWLTSVVDRPLQNIHLTTDQITSVRRRKKLEKSSSKPKYDREDETHAPRGAGKRWPPSTLTPRTGILAPSTGGKRPAVYHSGDDDDRARKAARTSQDSADEDDEDENEDTDDDDTSDDAEIPASTNAALATPTPAPPLETARLVVRAERIPSMSPSGPNGTWRCEEDSCNYIVRSAEEPEGKDLIEKHFQDHANRAEKMNLAVSEGTRGHMPIKYAYFPPSFFVYILVEERSGGL